MSPGFNGDETKDQEFTDSTDSHRSVSVRPLSPAQNLSLVYEIPDTWQIIGLAPNCYNNQSVRELRNTTSAVRLQFSVVFGT